MVNDYGVQGFLVTDGNESSPDTLGLDYQCFSDALVSSIAARVFGDFVTGE